MSKTLKDTMPHEFMGYIDASAYKLRDVNVVSEHYSDKKPWPGKHKNVMFWVILENGKAVGWNENPGKGWSFPVHIMRPKSTR